MTRIFLFLAATTLLFSCKNKVELPIDLSFVEKIELGDSRDKVRSNIPANAEILGDDEFFLNFQMIENDIEVFAAFGFYGLEELNGISFSIYDLKEENQKKAIMDYLTQLYDKRYGSENKKNSGDNLIEWSNNDFYAIIEMNPTDHKIYSSIDFLVFD